MLADGAGLVYGSVAEGRAIRAERDDDDLPALSRAARARGMFDAQAVIAQWQDFIAELT